MRPIALATFGALFVLTSAAVRAQTPSVQFRIIERDGQTAVNSPIGTTPTTDAVFNFAVQARVINGSPNEFLGNFSFDIVGSGEADTYGTLSKLLISNPDGTYVANSANVNNATVGRGGLSAVYTYLAGINPNFNGLINTSGGTFTNSAGNQEIGLVTGSPSGNPLLLVTDSFGTGAPDTWSGFGPSAPIDPIVASTYLGASGNWIDVYRFKYSVMNFDIWRNIRFDLANVSTQIGTSLQLANGVWGPVQSSAPATAVGVTILFPLPTPATSALLALGSVTVCHRRHRSRLH